MVEIPQNRENTYRYFQGFYLDFKNGILSPPQCSSHVLTQASPPPPNFEEPPTPTHKPTMERAGRSHPPCS